MVSCVSGIIIIMISLRIPTLPSLGSRWLRRAALTPFYITPTAAATSLRPVFFSSCPSFAMAASQSHRQLPSYARCRGPLASSPLPSRTASPWGPSLYPILCASFRGGPRFLCCPLLFSYSHPAEAGSGRLQAAAGRTPSGWRLHTRLDSTRSSMSHCGAQHSPWRCTALFCSLRCVCHIAAPVSPCLDLGLKLRHSSIRVAIDSDGLAPPWLQH